MTDLDGAFRKYELLEKIGVGGMAEVFKAKAFAGTRDPVTVVVKRILPDYSEDPNFRTMFIDEGRIVSLLDHPNVVRLLDIGRLDDQLFLAMEYVDGIDLMGFVRRHESRGRKTSIELSLLITIDLLRGLHHAHTRTDSYGKALNIVHRDVAPGNVLLSRGGEVKLTDFGIARAAVRQTHTQVGIVKGNALYLSPEQISGAPIDARADVYGAGMLFHRMLAGKHPFEGETLDAVYRRSLAGDIPPPSRVNPEVPTNLDRLVQRATALTPAARFASAEEFRLALEAFVEGKQLALDRDELAVSVAVALGREITEASPRQTWEASENIPTREQKVPESWDDTVGTVKTPANALSPAPVTPEKTRRSPPITWESLGDPNAKTKVEPAPKQNNLVGHAHEVAALCVTADGKSVVSGSHDQTVRIWNLRDRSERRVFRGHRAAVTSIAVDRACTRIISGSRDKTVRVWNIETGGFEGLLTGHDGWVFCVAISPDGTTALSAGFDRAIRVWDLATRKEKLRLTGHSDSVSSVAFVSPTLVVSGSYDGTLRSWSLVEGKELTTRRRDVGSVRTVAVSPDMQRAILGGAGGEVRVWDLSACAVERFLVGHRLPVVSACFSPDGTLGASAGYDGTVRAWDVASGKLLQTFTGHVDSVLAVAFSPDGRWVLSGGSDKTIRFWEIPRT